MGILENDTLHTLHSMVIDNDAANNGDYHIKKPAELQAFPLMYKN